MPPPSSGLSRNVVIAGSVVLFHAAALWALQSGLLLRAVEVVVPVEILSQFVEPPKPTPPPPPPPPAPPAPPREPVVRPKAPAPAPRPAPKPMAIQDPTPAPAAPVGVTAPPAPLPPIEQPVAPAPEPAPSPPPPAPPAPPRVQLPSTDAAYLQNPSPVYPAISRRLGEQGKVVVRVLIGTDGAPERVEIKRSSGFERLDRAATDYVMKCRYVPGKVNGVVQAMWYEAPVNFVLE